MNNSLSRQAAYAATAYSVFAFMFKFGFYGCPLPAWNYLNYMQSKLYRPLIIILYAGYIEMVTIIGLKILINL